MHASLRAVIAALLVAFLFPTGLVGLPSSGGGGAAVEKRQWTADKFCKTGTNGLCYLQITLPGSNPVFRIAIPDGAAGSFDTILEMITPISLTWTGFSWGGGMTLNPLTVAWPNGNSATISSRWATGRTMPSVYSGATYKLLSASKNATHWTAEMACTGCSRWNGGQLRTDGLNQFAWAVGKRAVAQPASASSRFDEHSNVGMLSGTLANAKNPQAAFRQYISNPSA